MKNIYKLTTLLIILCLCFTITGFRSKHNANVSKYIKFGSYPQTASGDIRPIEWQILTKRGNKTLLLSRYGLETKRFDEHSFNHRSDWENSEIRQWLNTDFYNQAFTTQEKKYIEPFEGDNVFLLSFREANTYFRCDMEKQCKATEYAVKNGAYVDKGDPRLKGNCLWWSRTPNLDYYTSSAICFNIDGSDNFRINVNNNDIVVRPAIWINL